jgi:hypothetical protein
MAAAVAFAHSNWSRSGGHGSNDDSEDPIRIDMRWMHNAIINELEVKIRNSDLRNRIVLNEDFWSSQKIDERFVQRNTGDWIQLFYMRPWVVHENGVGALPGFKHTKSNKFLYEQYFQLTWLKPNARDNVHKFKFQYWNGKEQPTTVREFEVTLQRDWQDKVVAEAMNGLFETVQRLYSTMYEHRNEKDPGGFSSIWQALFRLTEMVEQLHSSAAFPASQSHAKPGIRQ